MVLGWYIHHLRQIQICGLCHYVLLICFQNGDKFTSAEISIPFKSLNEKDAVTLKLNILGEEKNSSIDITSSEQIL